MVILAMIYFNMLLCIFNVLKVGKFQNHFSKKFPINFFVSLSISYLIHIIHDIEILGPVYFLFLNKFYLKFITVEEKI